MRAAPALSAAVAAVVAVLAATAGGLAGSSAAATPTSTVPAAPTTVPAAAAATTTIPEVAVSVLPSIAARTLVLDADQQAAHIAERLATPANQVAAPGDIGTVCAVVALTTPVTAGGQWQLDGEPVRDVPAVLRQSPGYGDCLTGADGDPLATGAYQFVANGPAVTSAAATFVVGADPLTARFVNDGTSPVCLLLVSPRSTDRYEAYALDPALAPAEVTAIVLADVEQEVGVFECSAVGDLGSSRPDRTFTFAPDGTDVALFATAG